MSARRRNALVTGSRGGIGSAIVDRLILEGWSVAGLDIAAPRESAKPAGKSGPLLGS